MARVGGRVMDFCFFFLVGWPSLLLLLFGCFCRCKKWEETDETISKSLYSVSVFFFAFSQFFLCAFFYNYYFEGGSSFGLTEWVKSTLFAVKMFIEKREGKKRLLIVIVGTRVCVSRSVGETDSNFGEASSPLNRPLLSAPVPPSPPHHWPNDFCGRLLFLIIILIFILIGAISVHGRTVWMDWTHTSHCRRSIFAQIVHNLVRFWSLVYDPSYFLRTHKHRNTHAIIINRPM